MQVHLRPVLRLETNMQRLVCLSLCPHLEKDASFSFLSNYVNHDGATLLHCFCAFYVLFVACNCAGNML